MCVCVYVCVCVCNYGNPIPYIGTIKFVFMEFISGNNNCNHYSHSIVQPTSVVTTHWLYMWAGDAPLQVLIDVVTDIKSPKVD